MNNITQNPNDMLTPDQTQKIATDIKQKLSEAKISSFHLWLQNKWALRSIHISLFIGGLFIILGGYLGWVAFAIPKPVGGLLIAIGLGWVVFWAVAMSMYRSAAKRIDQIFNIKFAENIASKIFENKYKNKLKLNGMQTGPKYCNPVNLIFGYFSAMPNHKNQPESQSCWNLNVSSKDVNYDFGTSLMSHIIRVKNEEIRVYQAWDYITFQIGATQLHTTLMPEKSGLFGKKKAPTQEEITHGLESTEFEQTFEIDYSQDPIMLRRFLQPRIMVGILDFIKEHNYKTPLIWIDDDKIVICYKNKKVAGERNYDKMLLHLAVGGTVSKTITKIIEKITSDIIIFKDASGWVDVFDLERRYGLTHSKVTKPTLK